MSSPKPIRILIVEDDPNFAEVALNLVQPILRAFPGSTVTTVGTIEAMLKAVAAIDRPDITLLDLTLPPAGVRETLAHLDSLEDRTAVVIVTGTQEELVRAIIGERDTPIVVKTPDLYRKPDILTKAITNAVAAFQKRKWAQMRADLEILRNVMPQANASQG